MAKRPRRSSKPRKAVRPPVIDLKAEETANVEVDTGTDAGTGDNDAPEVIVGGDETVEAETSAPEAEARSDDAPVDADAIPAPGPVAAAANNRTKLIGGGLALLLLGGVVLGGWLYRDYGAGLFGGPESASLTAVEDRLTALEATAKANAGKLDALGAGISAAEQKIAGLADTAAQGKVASPEELAAVQKSVAELWAALSIASGQESGAGQAANKIEINKLSSELTGIGERIDKAETAIAAIKPADTSGLESTIGGLESKIAELETELASLKAQQSQLATQTRSELGEAFAKLSGAVAGSGPFGAELDGLAAEAPAVRGIEVLRRMATTGVTSSGELADQLDKMAATVGAANAAASEQEATEGGLMGALKARLSTVVKVRKLDEADWPAVLASAAKLIRDGQLVQAMDLLASQPGTAPEELAEWQKQAAARGELDRAMALVSQAVLSRLAATGQSG